MIRKWTAISLALIGLSCASTPADSSREAEKSGSRGSAFYISGENTLPVGAIPDAVLHDASRNKDLEMSIEYPTRGGPFPVLIFSHGYGASKDFYTPLTEYWAGHGYICIKPSHKDAGALGAIMARRREERRAEAEKERAAGRRANRQQQKSVREEPPGETLWTTVGPQEWSDRARDISLIIDSLAALQQKYPELAGKIRTADIAVAGHGLGALTAMLAAGAEDYKTTPPIHLGDARIKAALVMSPPGVGPDYGLTQESWKDLHIPFMIMTGSLDRGPGADGDPKWRRDPFAYSPAGDKFFISFLGARQSTFTGGMVGDIEDSEIPMRRTGTSGYPGDPWSSPNGQRAGAVSRTNGAARDRSVFSQVKIISTAFFDAYLKGEQAGRDWIKPGGTLDMMNGTEITVERK